MKNKIRFGSWEGICIILVATSTQLYLNFPRLMAESAGTAGWILALYATVLSLLAFAVISKLYERFEGKDLLDIAEHMGGGAARVVTGIILMVYLVFITSMVLRQFSENMKIIALPVSPISFVSLFFLVGMVIGAYLGLEAIVRFSAIVVPIIVSGFFLILIGAADQMDISRITPILGKGPYELFVKGASRISVFSGVIVLFLLVPFLKTHQVFKKVGYMGILLTGCFMTLGTLVFLLVYPYPTAIENFLPIYQLGRLINYGRFFERVEAIFVLIWDASALLYLSIVLFLTVYTFKKTFALKYYRPMVIPFAVLVFTISLMPQNLISAIELEIKYFRNYAWMVTFLMTTVILIIARFVKRGRKKEAKKS